MELTAQVFWLGAVLQINRVNSCNTRVTITVIVIIIAVVSGTGREIVDVLQPAGARVAAVAGCPRPS